MPYNKFLSRYKLLSLITWPVFRGDVADGAGLLLSDLQFGIADYIFGRNKVFLKSSRVVSEPEPSSSVVLHAFHCVCSVC